MNLRRSVTALTALASMFATLPSLAADNPFMNAKITFTKISDGITLVTGPGGNILAITGSGKTALVDDGISQRAEELAHALAKQNDKPVGTVINTHYHFDHTGGNVYFGKHGAAIIAQEAVKTRLSAEQKNDFFHMVLPATPKEGLPTTTFSKSYDVTLNGHKAHLEYIGQPAHTDSDSFVQFSKENLIHTGDLYFNGFYPFIDYGVGGWIGGMVYGEDKILERADANTVIVPGHGPLATRRELKAYREMLAEVQARVEALIKANKTEDEVVADKPTAKFDGLYGKGMFSPEQFIRIVYRGIKAHEAAVKVAAK